jgi:hypothetical protein
MKKTTEQWAAEMEFESKARVAKVRRVNGQDEPATLPAGSVPRLRGGPWSNSDLLGIEPPTGEEP